jgi:hypothetical protein
MNMVKQTGDTKVFRKRTRQTRNNKNKHMKADVFKSRHIEVNSDTYGGPSVPLYLTRKGWR